MRAELRRLLAADVRANSGMLALGAAALVVFAALWGPRQAMIFVVLLLQPRFFAAEAGAHRTRSTLPLTRVELGRARWWLLIGFPGLALTAATLPVWAVQLVLGHAGAGMAETGALALWIWAVLGLFAAANLWLGSSGVIVLAFGATAVFLLQVVLAHSIEDRIVAEILAIDFRVAVAAGLSAMLYLYLRPALLMRPPSRPGDKRQLFGFLQRAVRRGPGFAGWGAFAGPFAWRLIVTFVMAIGAPALALGTLMRLPKPQLAENMPLIGVMLLMTATSGMVFGNYILLRPLSSALPILQQLPLTAEALAVRLVALALAPAGPVLLLILIAYPMLPMPQEATAFVLFLPMLFVVVAAQTFWAPALARRSFVLLPMAALLLPWAMLPFATKPPLAAVPPPVVAALALGAPVWSGIATIIAVGVIAVAYLRARRDLRACRFARSPATMLAPGGMR